MKKILIFVAATIGVWFYNQQHSPFEIEFTPIQRIATESRINNPEDTIQHKPRSTPEGTLFLLYSESIKTDSGIHGFTPGTVVQIISRDGDFLKVKIADDELSISSKRLTDDEDLAKKLLANSQEAQAATIQMARQQKIAVEAENLKKQAVAAEEIKAIQSRIASRTNKFGSGWDNPLDRKAYNKSNDKLIYAQRSASGSPYSDKINALQERINEIERPLLYEQVKELSNEKKIELQELNAQLNTFDELDRIYKKTK